MRVFVATDWPFGLPDFVVAKNEADAVRLLDARARHYGVRPVRRLRELTSDAEVMAHLGIGRQYVRDVRPGKYVA